MANRRQELEARYRVFDRFAVKDQKRYYEKTIRNNRKAGVQINRFRAMFAFLTGLCAALAGLIVQTTFVDSATCGALAENPPGSCDFLSGLAMFLAVMAVALPAVGTFFSTLGDLYQWDKMTSIYDAALENLEVADSLSPSEKIPEAEVEVYEASVMAFAEGTLNVMRDETAQWGQSIRTPAQIEEFLAKARAKAEQAGKSAKPK